MDYEVWVARVPSDQILLTIPITTRIQEFLKDIIAECI